MAFHPPAEIKRHPRRKDERGSAVIEFMMCTLVWVPLLLGTIVFGINLVRAIQVSQLARDTGHMYAYNIDFTSPQNAALLADLANSLSIKQNSGDGAILLSKITLVTTSDCVAANLKVCPNNGKYVFTSLFVFGNQAYAKSKLGNPNTQYYTAGTTIQASQYLSDPSLVATNLPPLFINNQSGQYAYVSEVTLNSQAIAWSDFSNTGSYARSIF
jgi:hypothetical protein